MSFTGERDFARGYRRTNRHELVGPGSRGGGCYGDLSEGVTAGDNSLAEALIEAIHGKSSGKGGDASALPGSGVLEKITDSSGAIHDEQQPKG